MIIIIMIPPPRYGSTQEHALSKTRLSRTPSANLAMLMLRVQRFLTKISKGLPLLLLVIHLSL